jgi:chromate transporter
MAARSSHEQQGLAELALVFLRLGTTAFGGPVAHIAMMEQEVVRRRKWLSHQEFLDLLGATHLIPGPNSTEMAIHVGHRRAGLRGLLVAGACFILPAMAIVMACAWAYVRFGALPQAQAVLYGVKPAVIAVIADAVWRLGRTALRTWFLAGVGVVAALLALSGVNELLVLFGTGFGVAAIRGWGDLRRRGAAGLVALALPKPPSLAGAAGVATAGAAPFTLGALFLFFLKVGAVLFGSGYVLIAFLRADLVTRWHWLTAPQLLDAVAVGQLTPGPLFTTATFIGYLLGGPVAAVVATVGIFLPAFFFVAASGPLVPRLRGSPLTSALLDGVNAAALALIAVVTWQLGRAAIVDLPTAAIAGIGVILLRALPLNSVWLVLGGVAVGWLLR